MKTVIVTGAGGQDSSYIVEKYLGMKNFRVVGIERWNPTGTSKNLDNVINDPNFILENGDICEKNFMHRIFEKYKPDYFYNMAAISLVPESFKIPEQFFEINTIAVLKILEEIRTYSPKTKFYQASTSEQIGTNRSMPQNTESKMLPNSPYAIAKLASYHLVRSYREAYGLFCVNGMLWNHEGPRRGPDFVTRKITMGIAKIKKGTLDFVELGNLNAIRDWGNAEDYVEAMIMMMHHDKPDDYAVATGESHSIREFVEEAFKQIGETITWKGNDAFELGVNQDGKIRVKINERFYRPVEVPQLCGDASSTREKLGWKPKTKFKELVKIMVDADINLLK
jgi:GDPmannose 4,6-dehydratase